MLAFINIQGGAATLVNVNFTDAQPSRSGTLPSAVILQSVDCKLDSCGSLVYKGGSVTYLNNGYEYMPDLILNPFIYAKSMSSVNISEVTFQDNMVIEAYSTAKTSSKALIYLENFLLLSIKNCQFLNNFLTGGVLVVGSSKVVPKLVDSTNQVYLLLSTHILFQNLTFANNIGEKAIIQISFFGELLNMAFINCTFRNNALDSQQLIDIEFYGRLTTDVYSGGFIVVVLPGTTIRTSAWVPPRFLNITNISFENQTSFTSLIRMIKCANVHILGLYFTDNGELKDLSRDAVISGFFAQPSIYATINPGFGSDQPCSSLVSFIQTINIAVQNVTATGNSCSIGGAGFSLSSCSGNNTVSSYTYSSNQGSDLTNFGLAYSSDTSAVLQFLTMLNNENPLGTLLLFKSWANVSLIDSVCSGNIGDYGVCADFEATQMVDIQRVTFINNTATTNNGGAIIYVLSLQSGLRIRDSVFASNSADQGGCIYFAGTKGQIVDFSMSRVQFISNTALSQGASLFVEALVSFSLTSSITTCTFSNNTSPNGVLYLQHRTGSLTIFNTVFTRNSGSIAAVIYLISPATTVIQSTSFDTNLGGPVIYKPTSKVQTSMITTDCTYVNNQNSAVTMEGGHWTDLRGKFLTAQSSQVNLVSGATATLTSSVFDSNFGASTGGAVYLGSKSLFVCSNCTFVNNSAMLGGAIYSEQNSVITISASVFQGNRAQYGSAISLASSYSSISSITTTKFYANVVSVSGLIYALWAVFALDTVSIYGNIGGSPVLYLLLSILTIKDSSFKSQIGTEAAFLELLTSSSAIIKSSTFTDGTGAMAGGVYLVGSNMTASDCSFQSIRGEKGTGFVTTGGFSFVSLIRISMDNVMEAVPSNLIYISSSSLSIADSEFKNYANGGIYGINVNIQITASTFTNGGGIMGAALFCSQCTEVDISDSTFISQAGTYGGAIAIATSEDVQSSGQVHLVNNVFANNTAYWGGGAYINNMNLVIRSCTFDSNVVSLLDSKGAVSDGQGGGLFLSCTIISLCSFNISDSDFTNNSAAISGGAISWNLVQPLVTNLTMQDNQALYATNIASFAIRVKVLSISSQRRLIGTLTNITNIAPGQPTGITLTAALVDHYDQIITTDDSSAAEISPIYLDQAAVSGMSKVTAVNGAFTFDDFTVYADPNSTTQIKLSSPSLSSTVNASVTLNLNIRACVPGESISLLSCLICNAGTYSFNPTTPCLNCPANANCLGNITVLPDPGYWRSEVYSPKIWECPYYGACLGGQPDNQSINLTGACATGYTSNLCQSCAVGFSRSGNNKCGQCPEENTNIIRITFIVIAVVIVECILVSSTLKSAAKPAALHSIYFKIFANYFQLVWLVTEFKLNWPDQVLQLFNAQQQSGGVTEQAYSFDCFIGNNKSAADTFYDKIIFMAVLPIGLIAAVVIFWVVVASVKHNEELLRRELAATIVILFFLIHPNLVKTLFSMFGCTEVNSGEFWLTTDMAIKCWDSTHLLHIFAVGIPAIVVWVFGVPLLCLLVLIKNRRRQDELWLKMQFGFLLTGYKRRRFYWEFVILFRKILVICCSVFLTNSIPVQALTVEMVLMIAIFLQYSIEPFNLKQLNSMELMAIIVADITIYCGLYYLTYSLNDATTWLFFIFIISANAIFLVYWLSAVLRYAIKMISPKVPCIGHLLMPEIFLHDSYIDDFVDNYKKDSEKLKKFAKYDLHQIHLKMLQRKSHHSRHHIPDIRQRFDTSPRLDSRLESVEKQDFL